MIEVGDFVRTNDGRIFRVYKIDNKNPDYTLYSNEFTRPINYKIVKHSKNIIDLIEVGDYVNGYPVRRIANFNNELCNFDLNTMEWTTLKNIDVYYNILTKEQYMQNCYKTDTN